MQHWSRSGSFDGGIVKRLFHRQLCNIAYLIEIRSIDDSSRLATNLARGVPQADHRFRPA